MDLNELAKKSNKKYDKKNNKGKTKWIPLGNFEFGGRDYIVFVRKNKRTGMLKFRTKRVNFNWWSSKTVYNILTDDLIDVQKQWDAITEENINSDVV